MKRARQQYVWNISPFIRFLLPLIAGILVENAFPTRPLLQMVSMGICLIILISASLFTLHSFFIITWLFGLSVQLLCFSYGRLLVMVHQDIQLEQTACFDKGESSYLVLELLTEPLLKKKSFRSTARIRWLVKNDRCFLQDEKLLVYFPVQNDSAFRHTSSPSVVISADTFTLTTGSFILIQRVPEPIRNDSVTGFDFKEYCRSRHIYGQLFLRPSEFRELTLEKATGFFSVADRCRAKILTTIKRYIPDRSEYGLLEALLVGFTQDLDRNLLNAYGNAGVVHIIAISGLHLALICQILQLLLKPVGKKYGRWVQTIAIIVILWAYSILSGASPSVVRSAMMFSLVLWGRNLFRESSLYHTLAASAFLLLCFDPGWLVDVGFQLSYAAVLSLALFAAPVASWITLENKMLNALWKAGSVSIAAQILTTPVSIFYFHRFPTYFLLANLLAVPVSSGILVAGILLSLFSWLEPMGHFLGWLTGSGVWILNAFVQKVAGLPGAVLFPIPLSLPQLIASYCGIFCGYRFFKNRKKFWLMAALGNICLFQIFEMIE